MNVKNQFYEIVQIRTSQYPKRLFPAVFLADGKPCVSINSFANYLLACNEQESTLHKKISAVCQLFEFSCRKYGNVDLTEEQLRSLVFEFGKAKLNGTILIDGTDPLELYWKPVKTNTAKQLISSITEFDKFQETFFASGILNPVEKVFLTNYERYLEFKRREKYDVFLHLFTTKVHTKSIKAYEPKQHRNTDNKTLKKVFPASKLIDVIESATNIRDKMLMLLLAFGGLRKSELLHLFHNDVIGRFSDTGAAWITLGHPVSGEINWIDGKGISKVTSREAFLKHEYSNPKLPITHPLHQLRPRSLYSKYEKELYAGFKGMTFSGSGTENFIHWSHEEAGIYFWKLYNEYLQSYFYNKPSNWPYHPFLFIKLDPVGYGMPLTPASIDKIFARCIARVGVSGYTPHSMRHFYGYYLATVLNLPIEKAQVCLHHASINSTQVYYKTSPDIIRAQMVNAINPTGKQISTEEPRLQKMLTPPKHWSEA